MCICVAVMCKCVHLLCVYACFCKDSQKGSTRTCSDKRVVVVHATRRRKCILSLDTINTEASKLEEGVGCLGIFWLGYIPAGRLNVLLMPHS